MPVEYSIRSIVSVHIQMQFVDTKAPTPMVFLGDNEATLPTCSLTLIAPMRNATRISHTKCVYDALQEAASNYQTNYHRIRKCRGHCIEVYSKVRNLNVSALHESFAQSVQYSLGPLTTAFQEHKNVSIGLAKLNSPCRSFENTDGYKASLFPTRSIVAKPDSSRCISRRASWQTN